MIVQFGDAHAVGGRVVKGFIRRQGIGDAEIAGQFQNPAVDRLEVLRIMIAEPPQRRPPVGTVFQQEQPGNDGGTVIDVPAAVRQNESPILTAEPHDAVGIFGFQSRVPAAALPRNELRRVDETAPAVKIFALPDPEPIALDVLLVKFFPELGRQHLVEGVLARLETAVPAPDAGSGNMVEPVIDPQGPGRLSRLQGQRYALSYGSVEGRRLLLQRESARLLRRAEGVCQIVEPGDVHCRTSEESRTISSGARSAGTPSASP